MDKVKGFLEQKILKGLILIIAVIALAFLVDYFYEKNQCNYWNPDKCNYQCESSADCRSAMCGCINKEEKFSSCRGFSIFEECVVADCVPGNCECINNKCENEDNMKSISKISYYNPDTEEIRFTGIVLPGGKNDCPVDGICSSMVGDFEVIWGQGETWPPEPRGSKGSFDLGYKVEVYGKKIGDNIVTIHGSKDYYIVAQVE